MTYPAEPFAGDCPLWFDPTLFVQRRDVEVQFRVDQSYSFGGRSFSFDGERFHARNPRPEPPQE